MNRPRLIALFLVIGWLATGSLPAQTIRIFQFSPEFTDQMRAMAGVYAKAFPGKQLALEIVQSQYPDLLKFKAKSGNLPDVFMINSRADLETYRASLADLSREAWVSKMLPSALDHWTLDGKLYGYPLWIQSFGIIYNKALFAQAGTLTLPQTMKELVAVVRKLKAQGITPFASAYKEWWVFKHILERFMAAEGNYTGLAADLTGGKRTFADLAFIQDYFDFIDLTAAESQPNALATTFGQQVELFAQGKAALIHQGDWAEGPILQVNPKAKFGFFALPVKGDKSLMVDSSVIWVVNKDSPVLGQVKDWLNWLSTSDYGRNFVPGILKVQGALAGAAQPQGQLVADTLPYLRSGSVRPWVETFWPAGFDEGFGHLMQEYLVGMHDRKEVMDAATKLWRDRASAPPTP
jgi:raffinose/stachyose/melibiose transport system substrate-binding protein